MMHNNENVTEMVTLKAKENPMLTLKEAANYTGFSRGYLYKLTMQRRIPYYKPNGKNVFFDKRELDEWFHCNRVATADELNRAASEHLRKLEGAAV